MPAEPNSEGMASAAASGALMGPETAGPTAAVHQGVPTSPTEPSARSITGRPSMRLASIRAERVAATPCARVAMRLRKLRFST